MRALKSLLFGVGAAAVWPAYGVLLAYLARVAPWPRDLARLAAGGLAAGAAALFAAGLARFLLRPRGWAEAHLRVPPEVARQCGRASLTLLATGVVFLGPTWLVTGGLVASRGRPISAQALGRLTGLAFEAA